MKAVNLLPSEQRQTPRSAGPGAASSPAGGDAFGAYAVLGLLALGVVGTALYVTAGNTVNERQAELDRVEQEAQVIQAQASSLQRFVEFQALAVSRTTTVRDLAGARFDWPTALDDVSRALPADVYVSAFDGSTSSVAGGSSIRGAISAPAIQLTGCTKSQSDVAQLMARLRNVRGVTRVGLASSVVTEDEAAAQPATAPTEPGQAAPKTVSSPCPKGTPPNFDLVAFFERAPVVAGAAVNTSAAGTTAAAPAATPTPSATAATTPAPTGTP